MKSFVTFDETTVHASRTRTWIVRSRQTRKILGAVKWHAPWRRYSFMPSYAVLDAKYLEEIEEFLNSAMFEHCKSRERVKRAKF